jgi:magnesium transporter
MTGPSPHDDLLMPQGGTPSEGVDARDSEQDSPIVHTTEEGIETALEVDQVIEAAEAEQSVEQLAPQVEEMGAPEAADTLERLEPQESAEVVKRMEDAAAAEALSHMDVPLAVTVMMDLDPAEAANLIALMEPDDAADILQGMSKHLCADIIAKLPPRQSASLGKLALYDPESAGGIMTTDIIVVPETMSIGHAIEFIQRNQIRPSQHDVYCVDESKRLVGQIGLRELLLHPDRDAVSEWMARDVDAVLPGVDREAVAKLFEKYDYLTVPVVDEQRRVLGMVTVDDVIDIISAEHTEDALKQVGAGAHEAVYSPIRVKFKGRFPWLLVNLVTSQVAASVIFLHKGLIAEIPVIATVMPVIANQAGNAGQQSLAVTLRGLVLGEIRRERVSRLILREMLLGLIAGCAVGVVLALSMWLIGADVLSLHPEFGWRLGVVAGIAMTGALYVGCLVGTLIPLVMDRLGFDPATASSIFLTMFTDGCSFLTFLTILYFTSDWVQVV